jgi:hypothetical protein
MISAVS